MDARTYKDSDKADILRIFHSNCPKYFDENDEGDLLYFLDNFTDDNYLVAIEGSTVVGCGGHYTKGEMHGISWVMFERGAIGHKRLVSVASWFYGEIEKRILAEGKLYNVYVNTTQLMEKLFSRYGFKTFETVTDGFGKGLDEYKMVKTLIQSRT